MTDNVLSNQLAEITIEFTLTRDTWQELLEMLDAFNAIIGTDRGKRLSMELHDMSNGIAQAINANDIWIGGF